MPRPDDDDEGPAIPERDEDVGSSEYDEDDDDEGGWATYRESDDLWDTADGPADDEPKGTGKGQ